MDGAIRAIGLKKSFGDFDAVKGIDLDVQKGEIFGFLGPNGAGKTTTMRMLTMMMRPSGGSVSINGYDVERETTQAKASIGISQQHISLDKDISVWSNIKHHALLHKIPSKDIKPRIMELSDIMGLDPYLHMDVFDLSGGWKRRVSIICSIVHKPKILFLDEPTAGLDTQSRHMLWDLIRQLNREGTTIFLTTHYIEEAEDLCDRVAIIDKGSIVALGSPKELCAKIGSITVESSKDDGTRSLKHFPDRQTAKEYMATVEESMNVSLRRTTLEDVFLAYSGRDYTRGALK